MTKYKSTSNYFLWRLQQLLYRLSPFSTLIKPIQINKVRSSTERKLASILPIIYNFQSFTSNLISNRMYDLGNGKVSALLCFSICCVYSLADFVMELIAYLQPKISLVEKKRNAKFCKHFTKNLVQKSDGGFNYTV